MATYRFEAKIVSRSAGRSATAAAAYRAGECIKDERTGQSFDYSRMSGVLHSEILTPAGTPDWMKDRAQLWNAVETVEKRKDAQLARDLVLSLPHELTHDQRVELLRAFVSKEFVAQGMIVDFSIHAPDPKGDPRNHHAHVMLTTRTLTGDGFGKKERAWNDRDALEQWREDWAVAINRQLERYGHEARVDHRSLEAQGIDREPEPKQGAIATEMEREGRSSHAGDDRRAAQDRNDSRARYAAELEKIKAEIIDLDAERRKRALQSELATDPFRATDDAGMVAQQRDARAFMARMEHFRDERPLPPPEPEKAVKEEPPKELDSDERTRRFMEQLEKNFTRDDRDRDGGDRSR